jgi:hypothetical protein
METEAIYHDLVRWMNIRTEIAESQVRRLEWRIKQTENYIRLGLAKSDPAYKQSCLREIAAVLDIQLPDVIAADKRRHRPGQKSHDSTRFSE